MHFKMFCYSYKCEYMLLQMLGAYSISKTALLGLTKVVAMDLAENNIRVNCIAPGIVKTKFASAVCSFYS